MSALLDDANIGENYPGVCSPLTCSFAEEVYRLIFTRLAERLGVLSAPGVADAVAHMAQAHEGRLYYRIDNWYRLLQLLPGRRWVIPMWQRSLAVSIGELPAPVAIPFGIRVRSLGRLASTWRQTPQLMAELEAEFAAVKADFDANFSSDPAELRALYARIRCGVLRNWDITLVNDLRAFAYLDLARRFGRPVNGVELASMAPVRALGELAAGLSETERAKLGDIRAALAGDTLLAEKLNAYLDRYGDRGPAELKLESPTFRTDPDSFASALLAATALAGSTSTPAPNVAASAGRALEAVAFREAARLNRTRIFGMVRSIVLALGEQLELDHPRDVFYLTLPELGLADGPAASYPHACFELDQADCLATTLKAVVAARKAEWAEYEQLDPRAGSVEPSSAPSSLQGTPCSAGVVEAEVCVVTDPARAGELNGRILVAEATDPGWVFLLSQAAGVIAERGSMLSHAAIIARELQVPAVVGVAGATRLLHSGDRVRLDGRTGTIEVMK
jgi:pyruvate,water dikinase